MNKWWQRNSGRCGVREPPPQTRSAETCPRRNAAATAKGKRSHVIAEAVTRYVTEIGKARLRRLMKERARKRADLDLRIAEEWFPVDQEAWDDKEE